MIFFTISSVQSQRVVALPSVVKYAREYQYYPPIVTVDVLREFIPSKIILSLICFDFFNKKKYIIARKILIV